MPSLLADVFGSNIFGLVELTNAFNKMPFKPGRLGQMGLFSPKGCTTNKLAVEERSGKLYLIAKGVRGAPGKQHTRGTRTARDFTAAHLRIDDGINADDVLGVRAFGTQDQTEGVMSIVAEHFAEILPCHEVTKEHLRAGAIQGSILDADGTTEIYNLYTEFGVSETTQIVDATDTRADMLKALRAMDAALGATTYDHPHVFCSDGFWDAFIEYATVEAAWDRWQNGAWKRDDPRAGFPLWGCIWENYTGSIGGVPMIAANTARMVPIGVPNMFVEHYAPAPYIQTVNTVGQPYYAKQIVRPDDTGIDLITTSDVLPLNHCPSACLKLTLA